MEKEKQIIPENKKSLMDYHQWINWAQKKEKKGAWGFIKKQVKDITVGTFAFAMANLTMYAIVTATILASASIYEHKSHNGPPHIQQQMTNSTEAKEFVKDLKNIDGNHLTVSQGKQIQKDILVLKDTGQINGKISNEALQPYEITMSTPLAYAIETENKQVVSMMLQAGANWQENNYALLKKTANLSDWRNFWMDYFSQNNPEFLPSYKQILQDSNASEDISNIIVDNTNRYLQSPGIIK
jgi:hypothetical protein